MLCQFLGNLLCGHSLEIHLEDHTHDLCFGFIDLKLFIDKSVSVGGVAVHILAKFHSLYDGQSLILRYRLGFFLGDCCEGVEEHLIRKGKGIDALFLELYTHAYVFQLSGIFQGLLGITSKSRDRLCQYKVDLPQFAHSDHPLELGTVSSLHATDALIRKNLDQLPLGVTLNEFGIGFDLSCVGVKLIGRGSGHTAIGSHTQFLNTLLGNGAD